MNGIVLYDIPSRSTSHRSWGPNTWKARASLNYKRLPYTTQWLEYPDIAPLLKAEGLDPNPPPTAPYTCPSVRFTDGTIIMDSLQIACELDRRYPDPPLHADDPIVRQVLEIVGRLFPTLAPALLPQVPRKLLNPVSQEYFESTRADRFGMSLSALEESKGPAAYDNAGPIIMDLARLLHKDSQGPYFLGTRPSFADLIVASLIEFLQRLNPNTLNKFLAFDESFANLHSACAAWLAQDE